MVPQLEDNDLMSLFAKGTDGLQQRFSVVKAVRDQQQEATMFKPRGEVLQDPGQGGVLPWLSLGQGIKDEEEVRGLGATRKELPHYAVNRLQSESVLVAGEHIVLSGGEFAGVLKLHRALA